MRKCSNCGSKKLRTRYGISTCLECRYKGQALKISKNNPERARLPSTKHPQVMEFSKILKEKGIVFPMDKYKKQNNTS